MYREQVYIRRRGILLWCLALFLCAIALPAVAPAEPAAEAGYVLGVFPHLPPRELEKVFSPIAVDLANTIDRKIVLRSSTTYERFTEHLDEQIFDIAFVQPFDYVRVADRFGYQPLATRNQKLATIVVVKENSAFHSLEDLLGKRIALPPPSAAVSHLLLAHLHDLGMKPGTDVKVSHHRSHISCMQQVLIGEADACGTAAPARRFFEHKMRVSLKVIDRTGEIPHTLFTIHPRVPARDRELIQRRILTWADSEEGRQLLARGRLKPFVVVSDADYDIVRRLAKQSD